MTVWFQNCWWIFGVVGLVCCTGSELETMVQECELPLATRGNPVSSDWGVGPDESVAVAISEVILADPSVAFVSWRSTEPDTYHVRTQLGTYRMRREPVDSRWDYQWESTNEPPLSVDVGLQASYSDELAAGSNPNDTT